MKAWEQNSLSLSKEYTSSYTEQNVSEMQAGEILGWDQGRISVFHIRDVTTLIGLKIY